MSMFSAFDVAGSAMSAQSQRMNVTASNMANADSIAGPDGETYRAKHVMFEAQAQNTRFGIGGVKSLRYCGRRLTAASGIHAQSSRS